GRQRRQAGPSPEAGDGGRWGVLAERFRPISAPGGAEASGRASSAAGAGYAGRAACAGGAGRHSVCLVTGRKMPRLTLVACMKITVLTHLEREGDKTTDVVVGQGADALRQNKHQVAVLGVHGDVGKLRAGLRRRKPELVFNLMETFGAGQLGAVGVVGFLDLLGLAYTGGGPGEFYIQEDKVLTKQLLAFDNIRYPDF